MVLLTNLHILNKKTGERYKLFHFVKQYLFKREKKKLNENFAIMLKNKELEQKLLPFLFRVNV